MLVAILLASLSAVSPGCDSHQPGTDVRDSRISFDSELLDESREVWIHLPAGYEQSEKEYPVLYVLDAEWVFDFAAGSVEFLSGEIAGRMPEMIVVGIPNTDRLRDLTVSFDTTAAFMNFMRFIENELIPHIDSTYRTNPHRAIYGWSSGSNICLWMLFTNPGLFHGYIASGTGISQRTNEFAKAKFSTRSYAWKSLFACAEGDSPARREALNRLSTLLEQSSPDGLRWKCVVMEDDDHTAVLPKGLLAGLEFLYSDCRLPTDVAALFSGKRRVKALNGDDTF
jgi:predicted alpha/beta superfamily hydrolase